MKFDPSSLNNYIDAFEFINPVDDPNNSSIEDENACTCSNKVKEVKSLIDNQEAEEFSQSKRTETKQDKKAVSDSNWADKGATKQEITTLVKQIGKHMKGVKDLLYEVLDIKDSSYRLDGKVREELSQLSTDICTTIKNKTPSIVLNTMERSQQALVKLSQAGFASRVKLQLDGGALKSPVFIGKVLSLNSQMQEIVKPYMSNSDTPSINDSNKTNTQIKELINSCNLVDSLNKDFPEVHRDLDGNVSLYLTETKLKITIPKDELLSSKELSETNYTICSESECLRYEDLEKNEGLIQLIKPALKNIEPHLKKYEQSILAYKNASLDATNSVSLMTFAKSFISPYFTASNSLLADDMQFTNFKANRPALIKFNSNQVNNLKLVVDKLKLNNKTNTSEVQRIVSQLEKVGLNRILDGQELNNDQNKVILATLRDLARLNKNNQDIRLKDSKAYVQMVNFVQAKANALVSSRDDGVKRSLGNDYEVQAKQLLNIKRYLSEMRGEEAGIYLRELEEISKTRPLTKEEQKKLAQALADAIGYQNQSEALVASDDKGHLDPENRQQNIFVKDAIKDIQKNNRDTSKVAKGLLEQGIRSARYGYEYQRHYQKAIESGVRSDHLINLYFASAIGDSTARSFLYSGDNVYDNIQYFGIEKFEDEFGTSWAEIQETLDDRNEFSVVSSNRSYSNESKQEIKLKSSQKLEKIAQETGLSPEELINLSPNEILSVLKKLVSNAQLAEIFDVSTNVARSLIEGDGISLSGAISLLFQANMSDRVTSLIQDAVSDPGVINQYISEAEAEIKLKDSLLIKKEIEAVMDSYNAKQVAQMKKSATQIKNERMFANLNFDIV